MDCDIAVIGAGIAGTSIAAHLAEHRTVRLVEMEGQPGYHSTGRSAAIFIDFYGNSVIRSLTAASRPFFEQPPAGFTDVALVRPRAVMMVARADQQEALARLSKDVLRSSRHERLTSHQAATLCPILDPALFASAILAPDAADIDVNALQAGYLRMLRKRGTALETSAQVTSVERLDTGWRVHTTGGPFTAGTIVNAAGAWAGEIAVMAQAHDVGIMPLRRSAALVDPPSGMAPDQWPAVIDVDESFYLKPEAGLLMISPADETPDHPGDVQPDEIDLAIAVERIQGIAKLDVTRIRHKWAGLRSFVADRSPVVGYDPLVPDFFWLAALGGYGIQTAPALSRLATEILLGADPASASEQLGISADDISPARPVLGTKTVAVSA